MTVGHEYWTVTILEDIAEHNDTKWDDWLSEHRMAPAVSFGAIIETEAGHRMPSHYTFNNAKDAALFKLFWA